MDCENVISSPSEACLTSAYGQNVSMDITSAEKFVYAEHSEPTVLV